jgi:Ca-activated chloride channel family protein
MNYKIYSVAFVCFCLLAAFPAGSDAASLYEKMEKGNDLFEREMYDESLNTFVDAQIEFPEDSKLKYNIASAHYKMKNYEEAVKGYLDVAATAQDASLEEKSLYNIGNAMYRQGKLEEAVEYYKKSLELDPEDMDAKKNLEFVREEIKRRINEAKKTEQEQQNQQQEENKQCPTGKNQQQQDQKEQDPKGQDQKGQEPQPEDQQQQQQAEKEEPNPGQGEQNQQTASGEEEKEEEPAGGAPMQEARPMTEQEAEQWLNNVQENREKFQKQKQVKGKMPYRSGKDW